MENNVKIELSQLVNPPKTDSISGREFGEDFADKIKLMELLQEGSNIQFIIDDNVIKAINDSFIKGLFNLVFKEYKTIAVVEKRITLVSNNYFIKLFKKNWQILQSIYNV